MEFLLFALVFILAYVNGANDISKGIATLVGGRVIRASSAILWGTLTTTAGAMVGVAIAGGLIKTFFGHGSCRSKPCSGRCGLGLQE